MVKDDSKVLVRPIGWIMLPNTEMEDTGVGIGLVLLLVIVLRNQEFRFGKGKYVKWKVSGEMAWSAVTNGAGQHLIWRLRNDHQI